jgi:hypothetical protein
MDDPKLRRIWWMLRIGLGGVALLSGVDKFTNLLTYWPMYVSDTFGQLMPMSAQHFMYGVGCVEAAVGLAILTKLPRLGGYVAGIWLTCIAINLVTAGLYDLATRDIVMAIAGFSLGQLTEVLQHAPSARPEAPEHRRETIPRPAHAT